MSKPASPTAKLRECLYANEIDSALKIAAKNKRALGFAIRAKCPALVSRACFVAGLVDNSWSAELVAGCAKDPKPGVRASAAAAAASLRLDRAAPILEHLLRSKIYGIRKWALASVSTCLRRDRDRIAVETRLLARLGAVGKGDCELALRRQAKAILREIRPLL